MKRLYLLRHAKSSWDDPALDDVDRPLAARGRRAAPRMGAYMRERGYRPAIALCSPARRAEETWTLVRGALGCAPAEETRPGIYGAAARDLLRMVQLIDGRHPSAVLIGHNPGVEMLAAALADDRAAVPGRFPTAALAAFEFEADGWTGARAGRGRLVEFVRPRDLAPSP